MSLRLAFCRYFEPEFRAALDAEGIRDALCTVRDGGCDRPGAGCAASLEPPGGSGGNAPARPATCFALLLGEDLEARFLAQGLHLLTPAMLADWPARAADWGFGPDHARAFFRESCTGFRVVDCGVGPLPAGAAEALSTFSGLPVDVWPASLDLLRLRLRLARDGAPAPAPTGDWRLSDFAMAFDLVGRLAGHATEAAVAQDILELFQALCAPRRVALSLDLEGGPAPWVFETGPPSAPGAAEAGSSFTVDLGHEGARIGRLHVEHPALENRLDHYRHLAAILGPVLGMVLAGARSRARSIARGIQEGTEASTTLLAAIVESSEDAIIGKSLDGTIVSWNLAATRLFGYGPEEAVGRSIMLIIPPDRHKEEADILERLRRGESIEHLETVRRRKDGSLLDVSLTISPIRNAQGAVVGASKILRDITERKQAFEALRASEAKFSRAFQSAPLLVALSRKADGRLLDVNDLYCRTVGFPREELLGRSTLELGILEPEERSRLMEALDGTASARNIEFRMRRRGGDPIPCLGSMEVLDIGGREVLLTMFTDITEFKRQEEERRRLQMEVDHLQKLESLGRLAGGVAHDMNNVLGAVFAVTETLRLRTAGGVEYEASLATIERAAARGRDLVKGLLAFSRKELAKPAPVDVNELVRQEKALLERTLLQRVALVAELEEGLPRVLGESGALGAALMNLCVNAVDAMPAGGRLTLRTRSEDGRVQVVVEDTGTGMTEEVLRQAMEPFFTTKPVGQGTGLGLATVHSTARAHGGRLILASEPGRGTWATLDLPALAPGSVPAEARPAAGTGATARSILLVDDDELLRASVPPMLERLGHRVEVLDSGRAALDRLKAPPPPDVVLMDLNMPELDGLETLRRLRDLHPSLPVVVATGFLDGDAQARIEAFPRTKVVTKPFTRAVLQAALGDLGL